MTLNRTLLKRQCWMIPTQMYPVDFLTVGVDEAAFSGIGEVVAGGAEEG